MAWGKLALAAFQATQKGDKSGANNPAVPQNIDFRTEVGGLTVHPRQKGQQQTGQQQTETAGNQILIGVTIVVLGSVMVALVKKSK